MLTSTHQTQGRKKKNAIKNLRICFLSSYILSSFFQTLRGYHLLVSVVYGIYNRKHSRTKHVLQSSCKVMVIAVIVLYPYRPRNKLSIDFTFRGFSKNQRIDFAELFRVTLYATLFCSAIMFFSMFSWVWIFRTIYWYPKITYISSSLTIESQPIMSSRRSFLINKEKRLKNNNQCINNDINLSDINIIINNRSISSYLRKRKTGKWMAYCLSTSLTDKTVFALIIIQGVYVITLSINFTPEEQFQLTRIFVVSLFLITVVIEPTVICMITVLQSSFKRTFQKEQARRSIGNLCEEINAGMHSIVCGIALSCREIGHYIVFTKQLTRFINTQIANLLIPSKRRKREALAFWISLVPFGMSQLMIFFYGDIPNENLQTLQLENYFQKEVYLETYALSVEKMYKHANGVQNKANKLNQEMKQFVILAGFRLRQVRSKTNSSFCHHVTNDSGRCKKHDAVIDNLPLTKQLGKQITYNDSLYNAFIFQEAENFDRLPITGDSVVTNHHRFSSVGGYEVQISLNDNASIIRLEQLDWVDENSNMVRIDFSVYNADSFIVTAVTVVYAFTPYSIVPYFNAYSFYKSHDEILQNMIYCLELTFISYYLSFLSINISFIITQDYTTVENKLRAVLSVIEILGIANFIIFIFVSNFVSESLNNRYEEIKLDETFKTSFVPYNRQAKMHSIVHISASFLV